ncbi:MAG: DNA primase, partial [Caldiserica bacterium]|nr:DNA primase [Caldisericota bacterium]
MTDRNRVVDEINARLPITDVVGRYVKLKKAGRNYLGLCPFHAERTPSFTVSPDKNMFYCFGCKAGGDVVSFVSKVEGLTYFEALQQLAKEAGIELEHIRKGPDLSRDFELVEFVQGIFREQFNKSNTAREYCQKRGLSHETIERFQVGYAPANGDYVVAMLNKAGFNMDLAKKLGVVSFGADGSTYAYMRDRLTFPILDTRGRVVAFGGRILGEGEPKYLNSPATPIFEKGNNLYGWQQARQSISHHGRAIIVEGYMDTVSMHQVGFTETVASLGTAFTLNQATLLRKLGVDAYLFFDNDSAGEKATEAGIRNCFQAGVVCRVMRTKDVKDPDDLAKKGVEAVKAIFESAMEPVDFLVQYFSNQEPSPDTASGKSRIAKKTKEILQLANDRVVTNQGIERISLVLKIPRSTIDDVIEIKPKTSLSITGTRLKYEYEILRAIISDKDSIIFIKPYLFEVYFQDEMCQKFTKMLLENDFNLDKIQSCLLEEGQQSDVFSFFAKLLVEEPPAESVHLLNSLRLDLVKLKL